MKKFTILLLSTIIVVLATFVLVSAFTGPGANQPPAGSPTASLGGVPSGAVMFFNLGACPSGWTEYTAARGRVVVGTPLSGTNATTSGVALTNLGARTITDVPAHLHAVNPPSTGSSGQSADHSHTTSVPKINDTNWGGDGSPGYLYAGDDGNYTGVVGRTSGGASSDHSHTTDIASFNSGSTGSSTVDVTMPYIQLRACSKD